MLPRFLAGRVVTGLDPCSHGTVGRTSVVRVRGRGVGVKIARRAGPRVHLGPEASPRCHVIRMGAMRRGSRTGIGTRLAAKPTFQPLLQSSPQDPALTFCSSFKSMPWVGARRQQHNEVPGNVQPCRRLLRERQCGVLTTRGGSNAECWRRRRHAQALRGGPHDRRDRRYVSSRMPRFVPPSLTRYNPRLHLHSCD